MGRNLVETIIGAVVIAVAVGFLVFAYKSADVGGTNGYELNAKFESVDGLSLGSDVRVGGIKVGRVAAKDLDQETYYAVLTLSIREDVKLPEDSSAAIVSDGLLGSKFVSITPGGAEDMLKDGDSIDYTQSAVNLETLIGKFMFSDGGVENGGDETSADELGSF